MLRFAPSPTGYLHIGNARVAILNYLYSKKKELNFFLRIDDTDSERSKEEFVSAILEDLSWLGINFKKIIRQSNRKKSYQEAFNFLKKRNYIYPCFETSEELSLKRKILLKQGKPPIYDRSSLNLSKNDRSSLISSGRTPHWRLRLDDKPIEWNDEVHGNVKYENLSISDPVLFRSDEMPLFTLTSVVDDIEFQVTNILRGDDHLTNTAAQIKLFKYFDSKVPSFGHLPLMRSKMGAGLSKRFNSFSLRELKKKKIFPLIIINYLNKIGSSLSIEEINEVPKLIENFTLKSFSKNSVLFNEDDLTRLNAKHLKSLSFKDLKNNFNINYDQNFWNVVKGNIDQLSDVDEWYEIFKSNHNLKVKVDEKLLEQITLNLPSEIDINSWSKWTESILSKTNLKPKELYLKIRQILTGRNYGPSMNELLALFNRKEILKRIKSNCES